MMRYGLPRRSTLLLLCIALAMSGMLLFIAPLRSLAPVIHQTQLELSEMQYSERDSVGTPGGPKTDKSHHTAALKGIWDHPTSEASSAVVDARYSFIWQKHHHLETKEKQTHIDTVPVCLDPGKRLCWKEALISRSGSLAVCFSQNFILRSTFIWRNQSISIVELSKSMLATVERTIFCMNGLRARVQPLYLTRWMNVRHPHLTHTLAYVKCEAFEETDLNAQGLIILNYLGNCSWPVPNQPVIHTQITEFGVRKTPAYFIPTPITRSFMQQWPHEPNRVTSLSVQSHLAHVPFQYATCAFSAVVDTEAPFFTHWLWHMKYRVQVEHVVMYYSPDNFVLDSPHINTTFVKHLMETGFLNLVPWYTQFEDNTQVFYKAQVAAYNDYVYRFRGLCQWTLFLDLDDFFVSWKSGHKILPLLQDVLYQDPQITNLRLAWPVFAPRCQGITGLDPPYDSDSFLPILKYSSLSVKNSKFADMTVTRPEVTIHFSSMQRSFRIAVPGVSVYHVRAGLPSKLNLERFTQEKCKEIELEDFDLTARANRIFNDSPSSFYGNGTMWKLDGAHGFD